MKNLPFFNYSLIPSAAKTECVFCGLIFSVGNNLGKQTPINLGRSVNI